MSTKLDFQLNLLVYQKQLELSIFQNVAKTQSVPFSYYKVITCNVIFISIKALYLGKLDNHAMCLVLPLCGGISHFEK